MESNFYPLTKNRLDKMEPHEIFASGEVENSLDGIYMTDSNPGKMLTWSAKRGFINDWAIYIGWSNNPPRVNDIQYILRFGDKVKNELNIKKLVPCDEETFKLYRF